MGTVLATDAAFAALEPRWNGLADASDVRSFFKTYEWLRTWWTFYRDRLDGAELRLIVSGTPDNPDAVLPAYAAPLRLPPLGMRVRALQLMGNRFEGSEYVGMVGSTSACADTVGTAAGTDCDIAYFENVRGDEPLLACLETHAREAARPFLRIAHHACPYVPLDGATWDELLQSRSESLRSDFRRQSRRFFKEADTAFGAAGTTDGTLADLRDLFRLHRLQWEGRGEASSLAPAYRQEFHERLLKELDGTGRGRVFTLKRGGAAVAALYGFEYDGEFQYFQTGADPAASRTSPGKVLLGSCIRHGFERGWRAFDFLRGDESYKKRWTGHERTVYTVVMGITGRGCRALKLWKAYRSVKYGALRLLKRGEGA